MITRQTLLLIGLGIGAIAYVYAHRFDGLCPEGWIPIGFGNDPDHRLTFYCCKPSGMPGCTTNCAIYTQNEAWAIARSGSGSG